MPIIELPTPRGGNSITLTTIEKTPTTNKKTGTRRESSFSRFETMLACFDCNGRGIYVLLSTQRARVDNFN